MKPVPPLCVRPVVLLGKFHDDFDDGFCHGRLSDDFGLRPFLKSSFDANLPSIEKGMKFHASLVGGQSAQLFHAGNVETFMLYRRKCISDCGVPTGDFGVGLRQNSLKLHRHDNVIFDQQDPYSFNARVGLNLFCLA
jgi:hypothetical protein